MLPVTVCSVYIRCYSVWNGIAWLAYRLVSTCKNADLPKRDLCVCLYVAPPDPQEACERPLVAGLANINPRSRDYGTGVQTDLCPKKSGHGKLWNGSGIVPSALVQHLLRY